MIKGFATRLVIDNPVTGSHTPITGERKFSVSLSLKSHKTASFDTLDWETLRKDLSSWSLSASGLIDESNVHVLFLLMLDNQPVNISFQIGNKTCSGTAFVTDLKLSGKTKGAADWSLQLKGSGLLDIQ